MMESHLMSLDEKLAIGMKSIDLKKQGRFEEARKMGKQIPLAPYLAKFLKDHLGLDALLEGGWNLAEATAEYGTDFLSE